jgi:hypothetical protein
MDGPTHVANKTFDKQSSVSNNMKHCEGREIGREINIFYRAGEAMKFHMRKSSMCSMRLSL